LKIEVRNSDELKADILVISMDDHYDDKDDRDCDLIQLIEMTERSNLSYSYKGSHYFIEIYPDDLFQILTKEKGKCSDKTT
jgi:hypothetical protein